MWLATDLTSLDFRFHQMSSFSRDVNDQRNLKQFLVQMHGNKIRNSSSEGFHSKPRITFFYCFHDFDKNSERLCQKSLIYLWLMLFYSNKASKLTPRKPFGIWRERGRCHLCLPAKTSKFDTSMSV